MTKKDYELIAKAISRVTAMPAPYRYGGQYSALALADVLGKDNPRFDKERFLKACGYTERRP